MIINNAPKIVILTAVAAIAVTALSFLLITYTRSTIALSITQSIISQLILFIVGSLLFFYLKHIKTFQAKATLHIMALSLSTLLPYFIANLFFPKLKESLVDVIYLNTPLILVFNILIWTIYNLIYSNFEYKSLLLSYKTDDNGSINRENTDNNIMSDLTSITQEIHISEKIKKLSIKDGSQIHIIDVDDILFIQANGDYVDIHSESGKYIKEHTMKELENSLPENFIRIHRSYIVNIYKISRAELFGKESYNIYLKKGACIRASATGYKQLKNKLSI